MSKVLKEKVLNQFEKERKRFFVVGLTGSGKSTIVNTLINNSVLKEHMEYPAIQGSSMDGVTAAFTTYFNHEKEEAYIDSIGFGDQRFSREKISQIVRQVTRTAQVGFNCVIVVIRYGRLSSDARKDIEFITLLFGKSWQKDSILVNTFADDGVSRAEWEEQNKKDPYSHVLFGFKHVIFLDNKTSRNADKEKILYAERKVSFKQLRNAMVTCNGDIVSRPTELRDWINRILKFFLIPVVDSANMAKNIYLALNEAVDLQPEFWLTCYGKCSICTDNVTAMTFENVHVTKCSHTFHGTCLSKWIERKQDCPLCRSSLDNEVIIPIPTTMTTTTTTNTTTTNTTTTNTTTTNTTTECLLS